MPQTTFTFRVDDDLKSAFADAAKAQDRTSAQLLRVLMRQEIGVGGTGRAHDAWFRGEVEQALREADDPNVQRIPNGDVRSDWQRQRAAIEKQSRTKTA